MSQPAEQIDYRQYLDPRTLAKIQALDIRARLIVEGFITGMHRSPYKGFSVEFAQHRQYAQGDDIRHIDWKVFGRTDRHYIKQYEEETNLQVMLVVDASESMTYAGADAKSWKKGGWRKFDHATSIAASLAYVAAASAGFGGAGGVRSESASVHQAEQQSATVADHHR